jgi:electron transfer flavoprotein beta subunit
MRIIVTIKQVPDTNNVSIDKKTGTLKREGIPSIINPDDKHAIEAAVKLKEKFNATVSILTMGPPQAKQALKEALAMGADDAWLLSDRKFAGADTLATAYTLSRAIRRMGEYHIIMCGRQAIDGDTAQVGPQLAGFLDIPQITYVCDLDINPEESCLVATRETDEEVHKVKAQFPVLITAIKELNEPRYPSINGIFSSADTKINILTAADLAVEEDRLGLQGSPTQVYKTFTPGARGECQKLTGTFKENAVQAVACLDDKGLI